MDIESNPQDYVNSRDKTIAQYAQFCKDEPSKISERKQATPKKRATAQNFGVD